MGYYNALFKFCQRQNIQINVSTGRMSHHNAQFRFCQRLQHAPWFRTLYPEIEVLHTPRSYLCEYLKDILKETLQNYEIPT